MVGPRKDQLFAEGLGPQSAVAVAVCELVAKTHLVELANRSRRQAVATGLVTREVLPFNDEHVGTALREPVGRCGAGGARSDDEHVAVILFRQRRTSPARVHRSEHSKTVSAVTPMFWPNVSPGRSRARLDIRNSNVTRARAGGKTKQRYGKP